MPKIDTKRVRRWAHRFGFGGHCFTKRRRFSTTFEALREARAHYAAAAAGEAPTKGDHNLIRVSAWHSTGSGYRKAGDALLAASSNARARERRRAAREAAWIETGRDIEAGRED